MGKFKSGDLEGLPRGMSHDGDGLYFDKKQRGASWLYKFTLNGKAREMGLGKYPEIGLTKARELAAKARSLRAEGKDPIAERDAVRRHGVSFEEAAREYFRVHCQHYAEPSNWIRGMEINVFPHIGKKAVAGLTPADMTKFLKPIWGLEKTRKLRQWINAVVGYVSADDPRVDRDLMDRVANALGPQNIEYDNLAAIPWRNIPALWQALPATLVGLSMKMLVLSGLRVKPVVLAEWDEFDFAAKVWNVPAGRVKGWKYRFRVPLTRPMIETLREARRKWGREGRVFPSPDSKSGHLSNNAHRLWLHKHDWKDEHGELATAHGLRSALRTWMDDSKPPVDFRIAEHVLQHMGSLGTQTEQAYLRTDQLEHRREVLEAWATYVVSAETAARERAKAAQDLDLSVEKGSGRTGREIAEWTRDSGVGEDAVAGEDHASAMARMRFDGLEGERNTSEPADDE